MHTIKITPNLLFEYQCTNGKFIRLPNRIETFLARIGMLYSADQSPRWPSSGVDSHRSVMVCRDICVDSIDRTLRLSSVNSLARPVININHIIAVRRDVMVICRDTATRTDGRIYLDGFAKQKQHVSRIWTTLCLQATTCMGVRT